ncbi:MAG: hypothetical protein WC370_10060 [Dehalococcoidales bacterium]|jgi:uncharacterized membrane protein
MKLKTALVNGLIAFVPVAVLMALWIWLRADALVSKSAGLEPGFLVPQTAAEAIRTGYTLWLPISLVLGLLLAFLFYLVTVRGNMRPLVFSIIIVGIALVVSGIAFVSGMVFAVEAMGEMLIIAAGYGVLLPLLAQRRLKAG